MWLIANTLSLLTTNLVLTKALGTSTLLAAAKSRSNLVILALMMTGFTTLSCVFTALLMPILPSEPLLRPLCFTAIVCVLYILVLFALYSLSGKSFSEYKKYVHLSALNCAVLGALYLGFGVSAAETPDFGIAAAVIFGLHSGLGFVLASLMLTAVHHRLYSDSVPAAFRGFPAVMVYIGLLSMAVYAISI